MNAFKAYDIRGIYGSDWNKDDVYRIGFFLPRLLQTSEILVGRDIRLSSDEIFTALSQGISDAGAVVYDLGLATTPMVYWATAARKFMGSAMITASHNPGAYNGLKISGEGAMPVGFDAGLNRIKAWMESENPVPVSCGGGVRKLDIKTAYLEFLREYVPDLTGMKVVMDLSNGMAGLLIQDVFGSGVSYLNEEPDGRFPGHDPNPLNPKNIQQLSAAVREGGYDAGLIFDGDADRVMFVDENGTFISPDLMIAVLGDYFLQKGSHEKVLVDIRTSRSVVERLTELGAEVHTWRVGRAYATPELKRLNGLFGGELAGHYYFRDFYYSDSGILAALILLDIMAGYRRKGVSLSQLISTITRYHSSGELNFTIHDKEGAIQALTARFEHMQKPDRMMDFDGIRLDYPDWWVNVRPSNTEPYLRFIAESASKDHLNQVVAEARAVLQAFE